MHALKADANPRTRTIYAPKPRLALTIGIVGHRPNRLPKAARAKVEAEIGEALRLVREAAQSALARHSGVFADPPPVLRVISPLAEGADRIAADAALDAGYKLTAILPFPAAEYEQDFADDSSLEHYRRLLARADAVLELPGERTGGSRAYEVAGHTLIDNADILLAVWDGGVTAGRGGTTEMVEHAAREGLPVMHVDATGEAPPRLLWRGLSEHYLGGGDLSDKPTAILREALGGVVEALVRPPGGGEAEKLKAFLAWPWKQLNWRLELPALLALLGLRRPRRTDLWPSPPDELAAVFARYSAERAPEAFSAVAAAYGWADAIAVRHAQIFRSAYTANFVLAASAVLMAAGSLIAMAFFGWPKWRFVLVEFFFILGIIANTWTGRRRDWHGRWMEAREVAERLRSAVPLWLLGVRATSAAGPETVWTGWYVRAHLRALGPRPGRLDRDARAKARETMNAIIKAQCGYHAHNARLMHRVEHRIERIGEVLFGFTLTVAGLYLVFAALRAGFAVNLTPPWWSPLVTGLTAGLPALAAATYGIRLIGDFAGSEQRSRRTVNSLMRISGALGEGANDLMHLRAAAAATSTEMLGDVEHWRLTSQTRELAIPG